MAKVAAVKAATVILLSLILLVSAALRFTGLDFGEGRVNARPDEDAVPVTFVGMETGVLMPPLVIYGGGYFYPLRAFTWVWETAGLPTPSGPNLIPGSDRVRVARWWSAILSVLTVALAFVLARRVVSTEASLLATLIVATSTLAVREAHFGKADSATAFAGLVFLLAATDSVLRPRPRAVLVAIALGYAVSNKASVGLLVPAAYVFLRGYGDGPWRIPWRELWIGAAVSAATVLVLNPHWLLQTKDAIFVAQTAVGNVSDNAWLAGADEALPPLQYHSQISLRYGAGLLVAWAAAPALLYGLYRGPATRVVALYILGPMMVFLSSPMVIARFILPFIPPLAVLIAIAAADATRRLSERTRAIVLAILALTFVAEPLLRSIAIVDLLQERDTRLLASDWLEANVPPDAVVVSWGTPDPVHADWGGVPPGKRAVRRNLEPELWGPEGVSHVVWHTYPLAYSSVPPPAALRDMTPAAVFEPFDGPTDEPVLEPMDAFYLPLGRLDGVARPGPRIAIYRLAPKKIKN